MIPARPTAALAQTTAIVLCGGGAVRLGGIDKPLRHLAGSPLLNHVLARIKPQVARVVLNANRSAARYATYGFDLIDDGSHVGIGPIAGLLAGLETVATPWLLAVPGDAPNLPGDLLTRLEAARQTADAPAATVFDGEGWQPLVCLLSRELLPSLRRYVDAGGNAPHQWLAAIPATVADYADWPRWSWSLNTEPEWNQAEQRLARLGAPTP
jgi:molybdopterin-guanine dinucleotide biosynthesis protein A